MDSGNKDSGRLVIFSLLLAPPEFYWLVFQWKLHQVLVGPPVLRQFKQAVIIVTLTPGHRQHFGQQFHKLCSCLPTKQRQWPFNTPSMPVQFICNILSLPSSPLPYIPTDTKICFLQLRPNRSFPGLFPGTLFLWLLAWQLPLILGSPQFKWSNPSWCPSPLSFLISLHCKGM